MSRGDEAAYPSKAQSVVFKKGHEECAKAIDAGIHRGLTKREKYAMAMMQGFLAKYCTAHDKLTIDQMRNSLVEESIVLADALLAALERKESK